MAVRQIVHIDEEKCNGCGLCVPNCAEGAIQIINGKAKLVAENLCDGLGACLGHCPLDAIHVEERDADEFDEVAVEKHLGKEKAEQHKPVETAPAPAHGHGGGCSGHGHGGHGHGGHHGHGGGCPGSRAMSIQRDNKEEDKKVENTGMTVDSGDVQISIKPQLQQWPVQLMLVPPTADYFTNSDLLITADCVPFAYPNFHLEILKGKKLVVGCPKLDDVDYYVEKLTEILSRNSIQSLTVAFMEVPCCSGIVRAAQKALADCGKDIPLHLIRITLDGKKQILA